MKEELRHLRAQMNLGGITRKQAAKALHLSYSALNRKLRGEIAMTREEALALRRLCLRNPEECV